ncbi:dGTPase [Sulfurospirillum sp. 1612]|uniref:dGTPase n=1 Tax=Sulfurospirillum sp. 1612 TaxID=3094835 RepID=UPI002F929C8A
MIDYNTKLTTDRALYPMNNLDASIESDRGRILSSGALRRLQKRTQVFALELNASIRSRLTHSLEVSQTARFIAKTIIAKLKQSKEQQCGLDQLHNAFVSTAEMTSLLHDIGNPPFGHFAEQTINQWMRDNALEKLQAFPASTPDTQELKAMLARDICNYDGNAQAIRLIIKLQRLNLSYTQILSVLKYTRGAFEPRPSTTHALDYLQKKPGFYYSEKESIGVIQDTLQVQPGHRFPITYIMEAADDISYLTADLEDAVQKGILNLDTVYNLIKKECEKEGEDYLLEVIEARYKQAKENEEPYQFNMFFTLVRAKVVTALVYHVADIYVAHHDAIFEGSFNAALLEYDQQSKYYKAVKILQNISSKYIYKNKEVQTLELKGYAIINKLFDIYKPLLLLSCEDFDALLRDESIDAFVTMRLIKRISSKQIAAYKSEIKKLERHDRESFEILEYYYRVRLIIDYISGMTDDFALHEYHELSAI